MKQPFEFLFDHRMCDICNEYSDTLEQSEEDEWICPECEPKYRCVECNALTDEATLTNGHVCFECLDLHMDLEPVAKLMDEAITKLNKHI